MNKQNMSFCLFNRLFLLVISITYFSSCASFEKQASEIRSQVKQGQTEQALATLKPKANESSKDQLIYALDYATVLQMSEKYEESAKAFQFSDKLLDEKDYHSVTQIMGSALGSEEMIQYKGESYEKFMLNSLNALNYLMLGDYDAALVECRRINNKIQSFKSDGKEAYEFSPFARYLSAIIWEAQKKYDDAYIEYQEAYKLSSSIPFIEEDLLRSAKLAQRPDDVIKWKKEFSLTKEIEKKSASEFKKNGELIVIHQMGFGPKKIPRRDEFRFPTLQSEYSQTHKLKVILEQDQHMVNSDYTKLIYNIDEMAQITLNKDYNSLIARRLGGVVAKAVVSDQIRQKNELLGSLAWIAMNVSDRADLRQWSTLPAQIQMSRLELPPGDYILSLWGVNSDQQVTGEKKENIKVKIEAGKKVFINFRSYK